LHVIVRRAPDGRERVYTRSWANGLPERTTDTLAAVRPFGPTTEALVEWAKGIINDARDRAAASQARPDRTVQP
jgi:hypothetical protein